MSLGARDQARLARILKRARELELAWPQGGRQHRLNLTGNLLYYELRRDIAACAAAETEALRRLAERSGHLHDEISLAHFYACLVPFERLSGLALRDDEFLIDEGDGRHEPGGRLPLKLIVENLRSAFNVGALFRTSECLGVAEIWLCGYTPGPEDEKIARTAMGTSGLVPWRRADRARTACEELRKEGYGIVALETGKNAISLTQVVFNAAPTAFVLGNERFGIETETLQAADSVCRIPVRGIKNSMNVGVAFGVAAFEWLRQYESAPQ